ncbi:MAG: chorismate synthase [Clostridiales bacterium]|jgi:chorismate synthase|nr:chorismate synthase [Clostridiales bacterium]
MRYLTAGESHGPALTAILEGLPANLPLDADRVNLELARRQQGYGRGGRMRIEKDKVEFLSGIRFGQTLGSPMTMQIKNRDFENWRDRMAAHGEPPADIEMVTRPRPGHADLAGAQKYNLTDIRNVLERASARETAARVAVGAVAKQLLAVFGIHVASHVVSIGEVASGHVDATVIAANLAAVDASPVRCLDEAAAAAMMARIDRAKEEGDSLGGVFEIIITGVPVGLGSHVHWDRKLDAMLARALMSIQAIKGVEVGGGFALAALPGSLVHDEIGYRDKEGYSRLTNRAGGIEGGISNGEPLVLRAAMKPIPTLYKPLQSVDMADHQPFAAAVERSDACAVPAAAIVGEAVVAWEVACALQEKLGGDSLEEMKAHFAVYQEMLHTR